MTDSLLSDMGKISGALERSGFLMEYELARKMEDGGWTIMPNYEVQDPVEGKSREIDLLAVKARSGEDGRLTRLVVVAECKSGQNPLVVMDHTLRSSIGYPAQVVVQCGEKYVMGGPNERRKAEQKLLGELDLHGIRHQFGIRNYGSMCCKIVREGKEAKAISASDITLSLAGKTHSALEMYLERHKPDAAEASLTVAFPLLVVRGEIYNCQGDANDLQAQEWVRVHQNYVTPKGDIPFWIMCVKENELENLFKDEIYKMAQIVAGRFMPEYKDMKNIWYGL